MLLNFVIDYINLVLPEKLFHSKPFLHDCMVRAISEIQTLCADTPIIFIHFCNYFLFLVGYISGYSYYELKWYVNLFDPHVL